MAAAAGASSGALSIFHGNASLEARTQRTASWRESWFRDLKAAWQIFRSGGSAERVVRIASDLPPEDPLAQAISKSMVNRLWGSLLHPPLSYRGAKFQFRAADGGGNSILWPELGKAGTPYAKSVQPSGAKHGAKPDPGDLFDMLMARKDETAENDNSPESDLGISSMLLYHADIIIHDIFRTNDTDKNISDTSSYLDLSPLYGKDLEAQLAIRQMQDGLLKPDSFAEERLLKQPPGVCIYLIMYNRFHNYVARQLLSINENGKFSKNLDMPQNWKPTQEILDKIKADNELIARIKWYNDQVESENRDIDRAGPDVRYYKGKKYDFTRAHKLPALKREQVSLTDDKAVWKRHIEIKVDDDLFQTARLVTCGLYIQISIHDYLRCLMRKHAELTSWTLDPRTEISPLNKETIRRGIGNQVSVEFNVLYRFHSPLSNRDAGWTKRFVQSLLIKENLHEHFDDKDPPVTESQFEYGDLPLKVLGMILGGGKKPLTDKEKQDQQDRARLAPAHPNEFHVEKEKDSKPSSFLLERDPDTLLFNDQDLAEEMIKVLEDPTCRFGAQNVPKFFRSIEILGILQSRKWEMATLNEFREFFKLPRHKTWADINSDNEIQNNLMRLYEHPDMVELYPGLFCEGQGRCLDPGTSCPGNGVTALWRGVFSDAVTLVRSDRFYTIDWNNDSLTAWGLNEVSSDPNIFKGGVMGRLFQRAFPGYFKPDSIHLWEPFYTPAMNVIVASEQKRPSGRSILDELQPVTDLMEVPPPPKNDPKGAYKAMKDIDRKKAKFDAIMEIKNAPNVLHGDIKKIVAKHMDERHVSWHLSERDIADINETRAQLNLRFKQLPWYSGIFASRQADANHVRDKIRFRLLKDVIKIKNPKRPEPLIGVSDKKTIENVFLHPRFIKCFKNTGYADKEAIPKGPLRDVLTQSAEYFDPGVAILRNVLKQKDEDLILNYFEYMSDVICERESLRFQTYDKGKLYNVDQIDIIKDFAIPVVTRFVADMLGFGKKIKNEASEHRKEQRPYTENEIYEHLQNCQDYSAFNSDETKAYRRRVAFQKSIKFLHKLAIEGVKTAQNGLFNSYLRPDPETVDNKKPDVKNSVHNVRKLSVELTRALAKVMKPDGVEDAELAALMLAVVLDAANKSVVMFAEVIQCLLKSYKVSGSNGHISGSKKPQEPVEDRKYWRKVQALAFQWEYKGASERKAAKEKIKRYVLEAQRINLDIPLARQYDRTIGGAHQLDMDKLVLENGWSSLPLQGGEKFLLDIRKASNDPKLFPKPGEIVLDRSENYLLYNSSKEGRLDAKSMTILGITGMIKFLALRKQLREAHDTMGRLKTAEVPFKSQKADGNIEDRFRSRYLNTKWDELSAFPSTWNLRYNGKATKDDHNGIFTGGDNSKQGHGIDLVATVDESFSANGGTWTTNYQ